MGLMYSRSLTRRDIVRPERGTTCASSRSGNVVVVLCPPLASSDGLMLTGRAPRLSGLKRPPWRTVCSCVLKCASVAAKTAWRELKSRGSSGLGSIFSAADPGDEDVLLELRGGEFEAGATLRFLNVGDDVWKARARDCRRCCCCCCPCCRGIEIEIGLSSLVSLTGSLLGGCCCHCCEGPLGVF